jgi:hypothetical protein
MSLSYTAELEAKIDILRDENRQLRKQLESFESRDTSMIPPAGDPIAELDLCLKYPFRASFDGPWLLDNDALITNSEYAQ